MQITRVVPINIQQSSDGDEDDDGVGDASFNTFEEVEDVRIASLSPKPIPNPCLECSLFYDRNSSWRQSGLFCVLFPDLPDASIVFSNWRSWRNE